MTYPPQTGVHWGRCPRLNLKSAQIFCNKVNVLPTFMLRKSTRIARKGGPCGVTEGGHPCREVLGGRDEGGQEVVVGSRTSKRCAIPPRRDNENKAVAFDFSVRKIQSGRAVLVQQSWIFAMKRSCVSLANSLSIKNQLKAVTRRGRRPSW